MLKIVKGEFYENGIHKITNDKYDEQGYDIYGFNSEGIHRDTGTDVNNSGHMRDEMIRRGKIRKKNIVERFLGSNKSVGELLDEMKRPSISEEYFYEILKEFEKNPEYTNRIQRHIKLISEKGIDERERQKKLLFEEKLDISEINDFDLMYELCSEEEKEMLIKKLGTLMTRHTTSIAQYVKILNISESQYPIYPEKVLVWLKRTRNLLTSKIKDHYIDLNEINVELKRIQQYRGKYISQAGTQIGFCANTNDKNSKIEMVTVTNEMEDAAKEFVRSKGEYVCSYTVYPVLIKILKGELKIENIQSFSSNEEEIER